MNIPTEIEFQIIERIKIVLKSYGIKDEDFSRGNIIITSEKIDFYIIKVKEKSIESFAYWHNFNERLIGCGVKVNYLIIYY